MSDPVLNINEPVFEKEVVLFPNPAKDEIKIKWTGLNKLKVSIHNSIGQELYRTSVFQQNNAINISNFASGLYFIKIQEGNKSTLKKLIKE